MLEISIINCLADNYSYLIKDKETNVVGVVDPSEFCVVDKEINKTYKKLDFILNTHHHFDHIGGNQELKKKYNSKIIASKIDESRIPGINIKLSEGDLFKFGKTDFETIFIPGHTKGHIAFYSKLENVVFTGDTLFSLGCGRIFEGTHKQMFESLNKIKKLPTTTKIYCGHEYTKKNLEFCMKYENNNKFLKKKISWIKSQLDKKKATIPISLKEELQTNIFLRCNESSLKNALGMNNASDEAIFKKLRDLKDQF
jgi:hydroxyacylglutathione hydrolase